LIGPVDTDFGLMDLAAVEGCHGTLGRSRVIVFDKAVVESLGIELDLTG
jgi:hypothetical protein